MEDMKGANNQRVKSMNRLTVLQYIRSFGPISRAELSERTHLSFTAVKNMIADLVDCDLISESGYDLSTGGRKPVLYKLRHDRYYSVGVHLSISHIRVAILDLEGKSLIQYETDTNHDTFQTSAILSQLISCIEEAINQSGVERTKILGIGMGIPGPLDPFNGVVLSPPNIKGLESVPLKQIISDRFGMMTYIEKDANLIALAEFWYGAGQGNSNIFYLDADAGIGSGLIIDGDLYYGYPFGAGEVGHSTINIDGPRCNCGNYGCLEAVASGLAIIRRVGEEIRRGAESAMRQKYLDSEDLVTLDTILNYAEDGDPMAIQILHESGRYVGIAIANVINLLLPEVVIIGGTLTNRYKPYFSQVRDIALNRIFTSFVKNITIKPAELGMFGGAIGAGTLVLEQFFTKGFNELIEKS